MDSIRLGRQFRALRIHRGLRQRDVAVAAGVSRALISKIERGLLESATLASLTKATAAIGALVDVRLRWNAEQLDRLLDDGHARLVEQIVAMLRRYGWEVAVEVSFSIWGERGSIDVLAYDPRARILLVVEVKSVVPDSQATISILDRKTRLAPRMAAERGWQADSTARLLVIGSTATSRRRIAGLGATYETAFPMRGQQMRTWLRDPVGAVAGLLFVSYASVGGVRSARPGLQRVRQRRMRAGRAREARNATERSI